MDKKIIIAIDGPSSSGKSTLAKDMAGEIGYLYVDTGAMYRALTLYALRHGCMEKGSVDAGRLQGLLPGIRIEFRSGEKGKRDTYLNGENVEAEIRGMEVAEWVSPVAALPFVRHDLVAKQQAMGAGGGLVMDGRDIGTVVFPQAELKIFLTASAEIRAKRRWAELLAKGGTASYEEVLANVEERDRIDSSRAESPLRQAADALPLDNSTMSRSEQLSWLLEKYASVIRS
ncbi:MAG: (d)CMP kinase [Tannerella sp.]|jgi:cytidylate kinase|nr:(d)CMP kinase [Tannerella sp.]